jgi:hypothetical protein
VYIPHPVCLSKPPIPRFRTPCFPDAGSVRFNNSSCHSRITYLHTPYLSCTFFFFLYFLSTTPSIARAYIHTYIHTAPPRFPASVSLNPARPGSRVIHTYISEYIHREKQINKTVESSFPQENAQRETVCTLLRVPGCIYLHVMLGRR